MFSQKLVNQYRALKEKEWWGFVVFGRRDKE